MLKKELYCFLASPAVTEELKQVAVYSESALLREALLQFAKVMAGKVNNYATVGTDQMVVVLWCTNCVAAADAFAVQLTDESQFGKYLKCAVDGYQPNIGMVLMYLRIYGSGGKAVLTGSDYLYHRHPLQRKLIAMLPQCCYYFSLGKSHLKF